MVEVPTGAQGKQNGDTADRTPNLLYLGWLWGRIEVALMSL
jgi:hypothetical protein